MHKYTVEFRIEGNTLVPSEVTALLGLQPSQVRNLNSDKRKIDESKLLWAYNGFDLTEGPIQEWESLEEGLLFLLVRLMPKKKQIQLEFGNFDMYWWCGHYQQSFDGGPTFSPELFGKLADFGVPLYLDNYFAVPESE